MTEPDPVTSLSWLDIGCLLALALSVALGFWRGLIFELLSLAGWFCAYLLGRAQADVFARWIPWGEPESMSRLAGGFLLGFLVVLLAFGLAARLVRRLLSSTPLGGTDRLLGALFGALRMLLLLLVVTTVVRATSLAQHPTWQAAHSVRLGQWMLHTLGAALPSRLPAR